MTDAFRSVLLPPADAPAALPLWLVAEPDHRAFLASRTPAEVAQLELHDFKPERGRTAVLTDPAGRAAVAVAGLGAARAATPPAFDPWLAATIAERLPPGTYRIASPLEPAAATHLTLGWLLAHYRYGTYRKTSPCRALLVEPAGADFVYARAAAAAIGLARDLVNTPPNDMGPAELAAVALRVAGAHAGEATVVEGVSLRAGFPLIAAVGGGATAERAPRLIDLHFPRADAPRVVLVGKGVCFDTGGLDIKPSAGMLLMKKDMGGAACVLGLAQLLRALDAPIDLRVLIPAVENSVDAASFRPSDVHRSRKGLTVEIGNTDAEGRLVLADALQLAGESKPDLLIDLATLTGAARVALGPELPAVFSGDAALATSLQQHGAEQGDPVWPMPLWDPYDDDLSSRVADVNNAASSSFAGAITAALFLRRFVADPARWLHVDLYAWNARDRPGRPLGGEGHAIRALYALIRQRCG
ncbi:MAG: leucyl aminopeptidase family protein [Steroidobacteraceae bacterium]